MQEMRAIQEATTQHAKDLAVLVARALHGLGPPHGTFRPCAREQLQKSLREERGDDSLTVVRLGAAGGVKVTDTRNGLFCKVSVDVDKIYAGSATMAAKAASRELSTIGHLHASEQSRLVMVPLAWCVDVAVRASLEVTPFVYRVLVLSHHNLSDRTIRHGSCDGGATYHVCPALDEVVTSLASALNLGVAAAQVADDSKRVTVHEYEQRLDEGVSDSHPTLSPEVCKQLLEWVDTSAPKPSERDFELEECQPLKSPLARVHATHTTRVCPQPRGPLPFDVELHALPCGSVVVVDMHRLGVPEVLPKEPVPSARLAVVWTRSTGGEVAGKCDVVVLPPGSGDTHTLLAEMAVRQAGAGGDPEGTSWRTVEVGNRQCADVAATLVTRSDGGARVLLPDPAGYWRGTYLTALLRPEAAGVLRKCEVPTVAPDDALPRSTAACESLKEATKAILSDDNIRAAADTAACRLRRLGAAGRTPFERFRKEFKSCLHLHGLGLRHAWAVLSLLVRPGESSDAATAAGAGLRPDQLQQALVSASLPSPRSPAAAALADLILAGHTSDGLSTQDGGDEAWVACAVAARAIACKGAYVSPEVATTLARELTKVAPALLLKWLTEERKGAGAEVSCRVKLSGAGATRAQAGADMSEDEDSWLRALGASTLDCLNHRQHLAERGHTEAVVADLMQLSHIAGRRWSSTHYELRALLAVLARSSFKRQPAMWTAAVESLAERLLAAGEVGKAEHLVGDALSVVADPDDDAVALQVAVLKRLKAQCFLSHDSISHASTLLLDCNGLLSGPGPQVKAELAHVTCLQASCEMKQGNVETAKVWLLQAESQFAGSPHDHPGLAWPLFELGGFHAKAGFLVSAVQAFDRCERCLKLCLREHHPRVAEAQFHKAGCLWELGKRDDAVECLRQAFAIQKKVFDRTNPDRQCSLTLLCAWLKGCGRYQEAVALARGEQPDIDSEETDSEAARAHKVRLKKATGERDAAAWAEKRIKELRLSSKMCLGQGTFEAEDVLQAAATFALRSGRPDEAIRILDMVQALRDALDTEAGVAALRTLGEMSLASSSDSLDSLLPVLEAHLAAMQKERDGVDHFSQTCVLRAIAQIQLRLGRLEAAAEALASCRRAWQKEFPSLDEPVHVIEFFDHALLLVKNGDLSAANATFADCERLEQRLGDAHPGRLAEIRFAWAGCHLRRGRDDEAKELLEASVKAMEALHEPDSFWLASTYQRLEACCRRLGKLSAAAAHKARALELRPVAGGAAAASAAASAAAPAAAAAAPTAS
ncbi:hypothetical protein FNF31_05625 [Cafeteria roenbergensis]|uniref:Clu domain-containing protein n=1 Tax=Cafeteria roenbergensis TaxID=33653 RepID=A0A5A8CY66_CAFRO|nr:hypothetical protein FNF31_05625 [Cafeteria roenbergensis]